MADLAPAPNQNDTLLILAALGIGAFVLISRQPKEVTREPRPIAPRPRPKLPPVAPQPGQTVGQTTAVVTPPPPVPAVPALTVEQQRKSAQAAGAAAAAAGKAAAEKRLAAAAKTVAPPKPVVIAPPAPIAIKGGAMSSTPARFAPTASAPKPAPQPLATTSRVTMIYSKPLAGIRG
jgi:hypothetical protein